MLRIAPRVALALAAAGVCLWLGASLLALDRAEDAINLAAATGPGAERQLAAAERDFRSSRPYADDVDLLLKQAQGLVYGRNPERAVPLLRRAVGEEPDNVDAWVLLGTTDRNGARARRARARAVALDPRAMRYFEDRR